MRRQARGLRLGLFAALGYLPVFGVPACSDDADIDSPTGGRATGGGGREPSTGGREPTTGGTTGGSVGPVSGAGGAQSGAGAASGEGGAHAGAAGEGGAEAGAAGDGTVGGLGGGGAGGAGGGAGGRVVGIVPCEDPEAWSKDPTGKIISCGGWKHRPEAVACPSTIPRTVQVYDDPRKNQSLGGGGDSGAGRCEDDTECAESEVCALTSGGYAYCHPTCETDADCPAQSLCECGPGAGVCRPASCRTDADCEDGALCAAQLIASIYACQSPLDECLLDEDCEGRLLCDPEAGVRTCYDPPVPGRPFLVEGVARTAALCERSDWSAAAGSPCLSELSGAQRQRLTAEWSRIAQMEHASIAAFARFSLELLALGAPAELVALAAKAQADETAHAMAAFELASAYAERPIGPAPLGIDGSLGASSLEQSVLTTFLEGCIGESVAALEAALARDQATDAKVKGVLERIARDEAKHAELAFKFVRWALGRAEPSLTERLRSALAAEIERARQALDEPESEHDARLAAHGVLSDAERRAARLAALREVVAPCFEAMLGEQTGAGSNLPHAAGSLDGGIFRRLTPAAALGA